MLLNGYVLIDFISTLFTGYTIYLFMCVFFSKARTKNIIVFTSFLIYCIFMSLLYFVFPVPIIQLTANTIGLFLLTYNFSSSLRKRVLTVVYTYIILMLLETFINLLWGYLNLIIFHLEPLYLSIAINLSVRITTYIAVLLITNYKDIRNSTKIPISSWLSAVLIPLGTLYIAILLLQRSDLDVISILLCTAIIFAINIVSFSMFNKITKEYESRIHGLLTMQQNEYYSQELKILKDTMLSMNKANHDVRNHLTLFSVFLNNEEIGKAKEYLQSISSMYSYTDYIHSKNVDIDSMLNYKIERTRKYNINIEHSIHIPEQIGIPAFDLNIILGNLIDNAIDATQKLDDEKTIYLTIVYSLGIILVRIINPYSGNLQIKDNSLITTKDNKECHGIGLKNVQAIVDKYNGRLIIQPYENRFKVDVMLYSE